MLENELLNEQARLEKEIEQLKRGGVVVRLIIDAAHEEIEAWGKTQILL